MGRRRNSVKKYNIDNERFLELVYFCRQYPKWKDELKYKCDTTLKSPAITNMPTPKVRLNIDLTSNMAIRRRQLEDKILLIESIADEVSTEFAKYIIKGVTEDRPYNYLLTVMNIPCSRNTYYAYRRKFFWMLDQRK